MKRTWTIKTVSEETVQHLCDTIGLSAFMARLLAIRGINTETSARAFLEPAKQVIPSANEFSEIKPAVERIVRAIQKQERVVIHGDYDVDGITATCILLETLSDLGLDADYYLPNRLSSGYGLDLNAMSRFAQDYDLLITVDCGTTYVEEIQAAVDSGLDVIVTDHHDPGDTRPPALAILNPVRPDETYPSKNLSGAGVAWKLACALREQAGSAHDCAEQIDLVALGMIADIVPIVGENRTLLTWGLEQIKSGNRPGLAALMHIALVTPQNISPYDIGFRIGPRLNAAGRIDKPDDALQLLMTQSEEEAVSLAQHLQDLNTKRQTIEKNLFEEVCQTIDQKNLLERSDRLLVVTGRDWHRGVLGIVASRLVRHFGRSVFLLSMENDTAHGSARACEGADLIPLVYAGKPHALSCGGHQAAAGMKVHESTLSQFENALYEAAQEHFQLPEAPPLMIDAQIPLEQIDDRFMSDLDRLQPCGKGNEAPLFYSRGHMSGYGAQIVGNSHLKLSLSHPRGTINAIGFGQGNKLETLTGGEIELVFTCQYNEFRGKRTIDLQFKDIRPVSGTIPEIKPTQQAQPSPSTTSAPTQPKKTTTNKPNADPVSNRTTRPFTWERNDLLRIYLKLKSLANEQKQLVHNPILAQMEKVSWEDFNTVLKIFMELQLLSVSKGMIELKEIKQKRELTESPTYRAILNKQNPGGRS